MAVRLGIDASNLRAGGGVTHLAQLLEAADPAGSGFERIVVWASSDTLERLGERDWLQKENDPLLERALPFRAWWQRFRLPRLLKDTGCAVLLVPGGSDASGFRPMVTMSRNMLPFEWREMRRYGFSGRILKNLLLRFAQTRTFRRADGVIFLTRYAHDVVMRSVEHATNVTIIPHGLDARFFRPPRRQRELASYSERDPVKLLYVSVLEVYKHQWHVADAVSRLRASGVPVTLDLVGPAYAPALKRLKRTLQRVDPGGSFIRYLGPVAHARLHELYAAADINVFASSCENMPNILLEGMASGLPIACSRRGPMPEVLGDAGVYFDPEDPGEIADAIRTLLQSPDLRYQRAQAAFERARQFSWTRCASETFAFLRTSATRA